MSCTIFVESTSNSTSPRQPQRKRLKVRNEGFKDKESKDSIKLQEAKKKILELEFQISSQKNWKEKFLESQQENKKLEEELKILRSENLEVFKNEAPDPKNLEFSKSEDVEKLEILELQNQEKIIRNLKEEISSLKLKIKENSETFQRKKVMHDLKIQMLQMGSKDSLKSKDLEFQRKESEFQKTLAEKDQKIGELQLYIDIVNGMEERKLVSKSSPEEDSKVKNLEKKFQKLKDHYDKLIHIHREMIEKKDRKIKDYQETCQRDQMEKKHKITVLEFELKKIKGEL